VLRQALQELKLDVTESKVKVIHGDQFKPLTNAVTRVRLQRVQ